MMMVHEWEYDFLRMTGCPWSFNIKNIIELVFQHNVRYILLWRSYKKNPGIIKRLRLLRYAKKYGLEISMTAEIGKGLYLGHPYNITVGADTVIGKNVNLHKGCTIGRENRGSRKGSPVIGDDVYIGINSTIVGKIKIGNDVMIAPNSFVNCDIPDHSIVIGNPCRIISKGEATKGYIAFRT